MSNLPAHSPVGPSSIKRVLSCPGSVGLIAAIEHEEDHDEDSEHATTGTAVHHLIEQAFRQNADAWQYVGQVVAKDGTFGFECDGPIEGIKITPPLSNAAQVFLTAVRNAHPDRNQGDFFVERKFHCPTIHPQFFGTSDAVYVGGPDGAYILHIWDYKNGAGVVVEVEGNEQLMGYACGVIEELGLWGKLDKVVLHVVQPNGFHRDGMVRTWETDEESLVTWLEDVLIPGIELATNPAMDEVAAYKTASGEHCRFCPMRSRNCPQIAKDMEELRQMIDVSQSRKLTLDEAARLLSLFEVAKIAAKQANATVYNHLNSGGRHADWKLVNGMAHRVWKDGAQAAALDKFGSAAMHPAELKSPAQIDDLPLGTTFTAEFAAKPPTGLTLAPRKDRRSEVVVNKESPFSAVA